MDGQGQECDSTLDHDRARDGWVYLYALAEPDDPQIIRYIGKSKNPKRRLMHHLCPAALLPETYKNRWLRPIVAAGRKPSLVILKEVTEHSWQREEAAIIASYRALGMRLTNVTDGGEGCTGYAQSAATRALHGLTSRGRTARPETIVKLKEAARRRPPVTEEERRRRSLWMRAHPMSREGIDKATATRMASRAAKLAAGAQVAPKQESSKQIPAQARAKRSCSEERRAYLRSLSLGRKRSAATLAKMAAAQQARRSREVEAEFLALSADGPQTFGVLLRRARLSVGLSLRALSSVAGIHRAILVAMEKGLHAPPSAASLPRLAVALHVSPQTLEALAARAAVVPTPQEEA